MYNRAKIIAVMLSVLMLFSLCACNNHDEPVVPPEDVHDHDHDHEQNDPASNPDAESKIPGLELNEMQMPEMAAGDSVTQSVQAAIDAVKEMTVDDYVDAGKSHKTTNGHWVLISTEETDSLQIDNLAVRKIGRDAPLKNGKRALVWSKCADGVYLVATTEAALNDVAPFAVAAYSLAGDMANDMNCMEQIILKTLN